MSYFLLTSDFQWMPTKKTNLFSHCIVYFKFAYNLHMISTIVSTDVCLILGGFRTIIAFLPAYFSQRWLNVNEHRK